MIFIKNKSKFFALVFSSLMLSLSLISAMISNFLPFIFGASFLRLDIGILFISMSFFVSGWKYGLIILFCNFIIHPLLPGTNIGFIELFFIGKTIFLITCLLYVAIFSLSNKILRKNNLAISLLVSTIITTIVMTTLNGLIFTPIFFNIISNDSFSINFIEIMQQYESSFLSKIFIMPNYWGGIVLVYGTFNIISLGINSLLFLEIRKKIKSLK